MNQHASRIKGSTSDTNISRKDNGVKNSITGLYKKDIKAQEKEAIDDVFFKYIVRVGKANFGNVFYDINLEVDQILPHTNQSASGMKGSTSDPNIS